MYNSLWSEIALKLSAHTRDLLHRRRLHLRAAEVLRCAPVEAADSQEENTSSRILGGILSSVFDSNGIGVAIFKSCLEINILRLASISQKCMLTNDFA